MKSGAIFFVVFSFAIEHSHAAPNQATSGGAQKNCESCFPLYAAQGLIARSVCLSGSEDFHPFEETVPLSRNGVTSVFSESLKNGGNLSLAALSNRPRRG